MAKTALRNKAMKKPKFKVRVLQPMSDLRPTQSVFKEVRYLSDLLS